MTLGSLLSTGAVTKITTSKGAVINPVTASGTILAADHGAPVLATTYGSLAVARIMLGSTVARVLINAGVYVAGDVNSVTEGVSRVVGATLALVVKIGATLAVAGLALKARKLFK